MASRLVANVVAKGAGASHAKIAPSPPPTERSTFRGGFVCFFKVAMSAADNDHVYVARSMPPNKDKVQRVREK